MNAKTQYDGVPGLPPVRPPSGGLLAQLFLVPGVIVVVVVGLVMFFTWMVSGPQRPEAFLHKLDEPNPEVRWRAASDLSQVLLRADRLASGTDFALPLAVRLDRARAESARAEKDFAGRVDSLPLTEVQRERERLEPDRSYVQYLAACLGNFTVPVGVR